ncbi:MAG: hypothetical protein HC908_00280 [Calothrix sp. SM1_7_51]|nr:hypothetical protein [Calothrix sp. SM1_7_51]
MKAYYTIQIRPNSTPLNSVGEAPANSLMIFGATFGATIIFLPFILFLSVIAYQKYRIYAWRQHVYKLEKLWRIAPIKDNHRH